MLKLGLFRGLAPLVFHAVFGLTAVTCATGCGALGALTNPKAAWAINEPAPMSVIVRRAEVAHETAHQVERLLGDTGMNDKSKWPAKTALKNADADKLLKDLGGEPIYLGAPGVKVRVVTAEAWLDTLSVICSDETKYPSLIASITPDLAKSYDEVNQQTKQIAETKGQIAAEEKSIDDKDQAAQRDAHEKTKRDLEDKLQKLQDEVKPKLEKFLASVKEESGKASPEVKARVGVAVVNLKRAVEDAKLANSVALVRYPLAMPGMKTDAETSAKRMLADVIEEKTGQRPDMNALKIDVKIEGGVKLALNGVGSDKLGSLSPDEVLLETTKRMKDYVARVLTLIPYAAETQELLSFESDVLDAMNDGMKIAPSADNGDVIADLKIESTGVAVGVKSARKTKGARSGAGLAINAGACGKPTAAKAVVVAKAEEKVEVKEEKVAKKAEPKPVKVEVIKPSPVARVEVKAAPAKVEVKAAPPKEAKAAPPAEVKPASSVKPVEDTKTEHSCDVFVTSGDKKICL